ncbi:MAG: hypothetical protein WC196_04925 [Bacilli bacterium]|jgi:hypothetical protein|nr:hypothetical protein [Bacilli bacterium]MDD3422347.1 hypothetical protein [Bacilli bacterium]MDD4065773.1 hypothetical protein [Bacilli bacterium]
MNNDKAPGVDELYKFESIYDGGPTDLKMSFVSEKLYDVNGDKAINDCVFHWKLYDEEKYVVASGTIYAYNLTEGERFRGQERSARLDPGNYTLVVF